MIDIKTEGILNNKKNGNMEVIDFVRLIHQGKIKEDYMRRFSTLKYPCPPEKLLRGRSMTCFRCVECQNYAISRVKEYKNHYAVGKDRFEKSDLDDLE